MGKYKINNLEFYTKGYLKGYAYGMIEFINGRSHEFLYRLYDPGNGNGKTLVSIDYGYENPMVDELWGEIEIEIIKLLNDLIINRNKEDIEFWIFCKNVLAT